MSLWLWSWFQQNKVFYELKVQTWVVFFCCHGFLPSQPFSRSLLLLCTWHWFQISIIFWMRMLFIILRLLILAHGLPGPSTCISVSRLP